MVDGLTDWLVLVKSLARSIEADDVCLVLSLDIRLDYSYQCSLILTPFVLPTDQHHFDNPVYAYQPVSKSQPNLNENGVATGVGNGGSGLNTIHNNLHHNHHKDTNNRHWDKLGNFTFDDEAASSVGEACAATRVVCRGR